MGKILCVITTYDENYEYFKLAMESLLGNKTNEEVVIFVVDFSREGSKEIGDLVCKPHVYVNRSGKGFCNNINFGITMALWLGYDYFAYFNDDVMVQPDFFDKGVEFLNHNDKIGFVSGVQQETNAITIRASVLKNLKMPMSLDRSELIDDLRGKWGDFSAWIAKTEAIRSVRYLDEELDPVGIIADNDWLLRLRLAGWQCWRNYKMRFLHAKGITQRKHRPGWPNDEVTIKARTYYISKWGTDPWSDAKRPLFDKPFNRDPERNIWHD